MNPASNEKINSPKNREPMKMSSRMAVTLPRPIEALSLGYFSSASSLNGVEPIIVASTSDGRLFHSNSIMDMKTSDVKVMECRRKIHIQDAEVRKSTCYDPFMLGMNLFAVKIDDRNPMYRKPTTTEDKEISRGLTMVVGGSSTLSPPTVIHIPPPSMNLNNINETPVSLVEIVEIAGFEEMDSAICSILFLDESVLEKKAWKGLSNMCNKGVEKKINLGVGFIRMAVVLMGFEDGSVYCTFVSETTANTENACTPGSSLPDMIQASTACKIFQMSSPAQPVISIMLIPPSYSTSYKSSASENSKIVCVGALGGMNILLPTEGGSVFREVLTFKPDPCTTRLGILMHAAPFPFTQQSFEQELKTADIDKTVHNDDVEINRYPFENKNEVPSSFSFIVTSDDGSLHYFSIQCNQNSSVIDNIAEKIDGDGFLVVHWAKVPIRREMSRVVSCWILSSSEQCSSPRLGKQTGYIFFALSTFRKGLCLMVSSVDKRPIRNIGGALISIASHNQSTEKYTKNFQPTTAIVDKELNSTEKILQTLTNILNDKREQSRNKTGESQSARIFLEQRSSRHAATVVSSNLKYGSDDIKLRNGNKLISFQTIEGNGNELLVKATGLTPCTKWSNENNWIRTCHVTQNTTYDSSAKFDGPSLKDLHILCSRQTAKGMERIGVKVYFGGTAHSISCQNTSIPTSKPLHMKIPLCNKFSISAFLSISMQYKNRKSPLSTDMKNSSQRILRRSSYRGQKRRRSGATFGSYDQAVLKRAKVCREMNFASVYCHKSSTIGSIGIILPLSTPQYGAKHGISDWDLMDGLASFEKIKDSTITPQSSIYNMQSFLRNTDHQSRYSSLLPSDRENQMVQMYMRSKSTLGSRKRATFITSEFIALCCPNILKGVIFPKESTCVMGGPLAGVKAIDVALYTDGIEESELTQDIKRGIDLSTAGDFNQCSTDTVVVILQSSLKKKMACYYMNLCDGGSSDSESDVPKIVEAYKKALRDPRKKKGLQYLKQKVPSVSQARISAEVAIQLYTKMRYLQIPIG